MGKLKFWDGQDWVQVDAKNADHASQADNASYADNADQANNSDLLSNMTPNQIRDGLLETHVFNNHRDEDASDDVHGLAGKIIEESGSNDDGSYIKFADGTMVCFGLGNDSYGVSPSSSADDLYASITDDVPYSLPFEGLPMVYCSPRQHSSYQLSWVSLRSRMSYASRYYIVSVSSSPTIQIIYFAVGNWK